MRRPRTKCQCSVASPHGASVDDRTLLGKHMRRLAAAVFGPAVTWPRGAALAQRCEYAYYASCTSIGRQASHVCPGSARRNSALRLDSPGDAAHAIYVGPWEQYCTSALGNEFTHDRRCRLPGQQDWPSRVFRQPTRWGAAPPLQPTSHHVVGPLCWWRGLW